MLKQLFDVVKEILGLSQDVKRHEAQVRELQDEMKAVTASLRDLTFELRRKRENEAHEREKMALYLENALLRFERRLTPGESASTGRPGDTG